MYSLPAFTNYVQFLTILQIVLTFKTTMTLPLTTQSELPDLPGKFVLTLQASTFHILYEAFHGSLKMALTVPPESVIYNT